MTSFSVSTSYVLRETEKTCVVHYDVILCKYVICTKRDREEKTCVVHYDAILCEHLYTCTHREIERRDLCRTI